uniref:MFS domain-containing protein n=1 Tax=Elaeophora elaphi TaxID=1147741 RepID=A0A0R3S081_9BILA
MAHLRERMNKNWVPLSIFILLLFDLLAFTSILPLFPALIDYYGMRQQRDQLYDGIEMFCQFFQNAIGTPSSKRLHSVFFGGVLGSLYCLLQFLSSPLLGALSDVYGRKPILLLSIAGTLLSYIIWASTSNFTCFVLSRIVGGLSKASVSICIAAMADVYSQKKTGQGMAIIGAAFSVGFLVGPMVGVYFSRIASGAGTELAVDALAKFAISLSAIELVFVALILPETLDISQRKTLVNEVLRNCLLYIKPNALFQFAAISNHPGVEIIRSYGGAYFIYMFFYSGLEFTLSFLTHTRFNYDSMQQGTMYFYVGILMTIVQGGVRRIPNDKQHLAAICGISFTIPAYVIIGHSSSAKVFYAGLALYAVASGLVVPCMTSCVSNQATDDVKGVTIGVFRCLVFWLYGPTVCYVIGGILLIIPVVMLLLFSSGITAIKQE